MNIIGFNTMGAIRFLGSFNSGAALKNNSEKTIRLTHSNGISHCEDAKSTIMQMAMPNPTPSNKENGKIGIEFRKL